MSSAKAGTFLNTIMVIKMIEAVIIAGIVLILILLYVYGTFFNR